MSAAGNVLSIKYPTGEALKNEIEAHLMPTTADKVATLRKLTQERLDIVFSVSLHSTIYNKIIGEEVKSLPDHLITF